MGDPKAKKTADYVLRALWPAVLLAGLWWLTPEIRRTVTWSLPLDTGEGWLFAITKTFDNYWFPLFPVILATLQYHLPAWLQAGAHKFIFMLPAALAFAAGARLHSFPAGAVAGLLSAVLSFFLIRDERIDYEQNLEQTVIAVTMLMLVSGLSLKFRSRLARGFFIGLLLAVALYAKGVIALFIPLLLIYEARRKEGAVPLKEQWPVLAVVLSALLVWSLVNLRSGNGFVLLEGGYRTANIALGAMGLVSTMEGDARALSGVAQDQSMAVWAALEALRHPLRYLLAIPQRLYYLLFNNPLVPGLAALFAAWLFGLFRLRRTKAVRPLLLLILYLLLIHLLMPVEGRYFVPLWFLVCVFAGISLADVFTGAAVANVPEPPGTKAVFFAAAAPMLAFFGFSFLLLISHPARSGAPRDLYALQARHPSSPWLNSRAGDAAMKAGDPGKAADYYSKALERENVRWRKLPYLKAMFLAGRISGAGIKDHYTGPFEYAVLMLASLRYAEEGNPAKAAKLLPCALQTCIKDSTGLRYVSGEADLAVLKKLHKDGSANCLAVLSKMLSPLGSGRRKALLSKLDRIYPGLWSPELLDSVFERDFGNMDGPATLKDINGTLTRPQSVLKACEGLSAAAPPCMTPAAGTVGLRRPPPAAAPGAGQGKPPPADPRTLMASCSALAAAGKKAAALQACQAAAAAIDSAGTEPGDKLLMLRSDASFKSYKLLKALGRNEEAAETLFWTVNTASPSWPALPAARKLLEREASEKSR